MQACELLERAQRVQRHLVRHGGIEAGAAVWEPPVDVRESPNGLFFTFALPGVTPDCIEVALQPDALTVSAWRPPRLGPRGSLVRRLEIPHGRFLRRIALQGTRLRLGETTYANGCLEVRLYKAGENRGSN